MIRRNLANDWMIAAAMLLSTWLPAPVASALGFQGASSVLHGLPRSSHEIQIHPFGAQTSFGLFGRGQISFKDAVSQALRASSLNPLIEMRTTTVHGFGLHSSTESLDYRFFVNGVPLCNFQVRAHELQNKQMLVLGRLPEIDPYETTPISDWPNLEDTIERVTETVLSDTSAGHLGLATKSRCLFVMDGHLLPVWNLTVYADGLPYHVLADAYETIKVSPAFFDVDGSAKVYPLNRLDTALIDVPLKELIGDGSLTSAYLKTVVPTSITKAVETTHTFAYPTTDTRFDEAQVFAHAQTHFDFFKSLGFEWYGPKPLEVKIHIAPAGRPNNALFIPGSNVEGTKPSISIHDGDGVDLQNLITDGDVVSHEFGHHVIYKTLRSTEGESLVLHEGLADFFAFSRTNDPCLGESICPKGSGACILENQCLRTAANGLIYNDQVWVDWAGPKYRLGHLHGQLISGLLWDLRTEHNMPGADVSALVFKAVSLFQEDSGLRDFMLSLFTADLDVFGGKYAGFIHAAGTKRGMTEFFSDVTPGQPIPPLSGNKGAAATTPPKAKESEREKNSDGSPFKCGTIAYDQDKTSVVLLTFLLALPLLVAMRPLPARSRNRNQRR